MKKTMTAILVTLLMIFGLSGQALAADSYVFEGGANAFVTDVSGSATGGFTGMEPGETRDLTLSLTNGDSKDVNFYMSAEILKNLAEQGDQNAVYTFTISKNGTPFFETVIGGGSDSQNISIGAEYLKEDNTILLDTMAPGQKDTLTVSLALDGDSAENVYMNQNGKIQLVFSAGSPVTNEPGTVINRIVRTITGQSSTSPDTGVQAGDILLLVAFAAVIAGIILAIILLRKKHKEGKQS